jgi:hypothetical protein
VLRFLCEKLNSCFHVQKQFNKRDYNCEFFSILSCYFLSSQGFSSVTFSSGSVIKIFFAADPYTDPVSFAADPDAQISGALPLKQGFKSAPTYKIQVGFGRAAPHVFLSSLTRKMGRCAPPPPFSHLYMFPSRRD